MRVQPIISNRFLSCKDLRSTWKYGYTESVSWNNDEITRKVYGWDIWDELERDMGRMGCGYWLEGRTILDGCM